MVAAFAAGTEPLPGSRHGLDEDLEPVPPRLPRVVRRSIDAWLTSRRGAARWES